MDELQQSIALILLVLICSALPFLEVRLQKRNDRIKIVCLLIANEHDWISAEEITLHAGTSLRSVKRNLEWGIKGRIILGNFENNMFERISQRNPEDIAYFIPEGTNAI